MSLVHKVNMKKKIHCHEDRLTIHQPHKSIFHHMAITTCNRKNNIQDWSSPHPLPHVTIYQWDKRG